MNRCRTNMTLFNSFKIRLLMQFTVITCFAPTYCQSGCGPVTNISSVINDIERVFITWEPKPKMLSLCNISYYEFSYSPHTNNKWVTTKTRINYITFSKHEICATYSIKITPKKASNSSIGIATNYSLLPINSALRNLKALEIKPRSVELNWTYYMCTPKRKFVNFNIKIEDQNSKRNSSNIQFNISKDITLCNYGLSDLVPYNKYYCTVTEIENTNETSHHSESITFTTDSTIPVLPSKEHTKDHLRVSPIENNRRQVKVTISDELFPNYNEMIKYYAIFVFENDGHTSDIPRNETKVDNVIWPPPKDYWRHTLPHNKVEKYQTSPDEWMPFKNGVKEATFIIGSDENCTKENMNEYCNGPLRLNTNYYISVRAFTTKEYQETWPISFSTEGEDEKSNQIKIWYFALGNLLFVILLVTVAGIMHCVINEKNPWKDSKGFRTSLNLSDLNYQQLINRTSWEIENEYNALTFYSKANSSTNFSCDIAMMPENKPKNRYVDIIPYDYNRVVLKKRSNDYINASFIKYEENTREYIACQGPMKDTCTDMWQMILDQDVDSIVMLCEASEINKTKCEKYFPNNEEMYVQFNDIKVEKLRTDDHKNLSFTMRKLFVERGNLKKSVNHYQYHGWPDFGTPKDPSTLVELCLEINQKCPKGLIVVHCSAGVGRTGTYIACDILIQLIQKNIEPLSVCRTVQTLRTQRKNMVQTQDQYQFVYKCLAYLLKRQYPARSVIGKK